ncbi:MAG: hypothetical protein JXR97_06535, partial [Planctomycetes bacterium]|nr:hypothetical protein [Planctomycetota bacterium]
LLASTFPTFFVLTFVSADEDDMMKITTGLTKAIPPTFDFAGAWQSLSQVNLSFVTDMLCAFAIVTLSMAFATVVGILASSFSKKSSSATAISYGFILLWSIGTLIPYFISAGIPDAIVTLSLTVNPFAAAANAVSEDVFPGQPIGLWFNHILILLGATAVFLAVAIFKVRSMMQPQK